MKTEWKLFFGLNGFLFLMAALYGWWTWLNSGGYDHGKIEFVGFVALILSGLLMAMCGGYFWFVSRRIDLRPEDRPDAEIADGVGELGFFSPSSYWPFGLALSAASMGLALAFWYSWLIIIAAVALLVTIGGLLFEYYVGQNATQS